MLSEFFCAISVVVFILAIVLECWKAYVTRTKLKAFYQVKGWPGKLEKRFFFDIFS